jgi:hypothetical protein
MESIGIEPILFACKAKDLPINLWSLYIYIYIVWYMNKINKIIYINKYI